MTIALRSFNENGITLFRASLENMRSGLVQSLPDNLLVSGEFSVPHSSDREVLPTLFASKLEAARYLHEITNDLKDPFYDSGLWSWLSAFYFDSACPVERDGARKPKADYRYILERGRDWRHFYRHLLAGPVRTYDFHKENAKLLLSGPIHKMGDFVEQLCSRQEFAANKALIEVATNLYWDDTSNRTKRGAAPNAPKPGTLRRFVAVIQQFELTYDLYSMKGDEILSLLPDEFSPWKGTATTT